ncbi:Membrane proteinase PrsW, cleaves anti-sigma factor RsiW, M82 family [Caminicella sporogenes DSM 14501]|uniref:Protease PrsW n=1 Tax=Caminicella sporogenes DSM 14501 TaxID=1121266 RepID=A0A1M6N3J7_9FIRM|nr:PrsW family glutamic-type intramembrane protease [Caminicella sporogenes]RKD22377.1 peptidase [Caminicella sporogenes]SHJ90285.1 Membrane proteinase PrsW, cleaves anti-sigma factor RsiW, M82 family [Caminicella sporogenes DSM 14501]
MNTRLFIIAVTPGIALALSVYFTDRYDKEPLSLLLKVFILGALSVIPVAIVENFLVSLNIFTGYIGAAYTAFVVAGLTEEFFKRGVVLRTAFKHEAFDEKLDGIVYAIFSALGFATVENIMYVVFRFTTNPHIGLYRGVFSVPAHMLFAVTMGYYLSLAKFATESKMRKKYLKKSLFIPMVLHGIFNFILMVNISFVFVIFIPYVIYLWIVNLRKLNEYYTESKILFKRQIDMK